MPRELTRPVDTTLDGRTLSPEALGWSRTPLHRTRLSGAWGRNKRWEYWGITSSECALAVTIADLDYLSLAAISLLDRRTLRFVEKVVPMPLGLGRAAHPERVRGGDLRVRAPGLAIDVHERAGSTEIEASCRSLREGVRIEATLSIEAARESMNVLVPWSAERFQFTSKQPARAVRGEVRANGREYALGEGTEAFACLDFGRGRWPYATTWNWAAASGVQGGRVVGITLGGKWTDGTGTTENGLVVDGALTKIHETLEWRYERGAWTRPWAIESEGGEAVSLSFEPSYERRSVIELGVGRSEIHQCFGLFTGHLRAANGERIEVRDLFGWAEEHRARW